MEKVNGYLFCKEYSGDGYRLIDCNKASIYHDSGWVSQYLWISDGLVKKVINGECCDIDRDDYVSKEEDTVVTATPFEALRQYILTKEYVEAYVRIKGNRQYYRHEHLAYISDLAEDKEKWELATHECDCFYIYTEEDGLQKVEW